MAIQILPNTGLGERLGSALGTGLGSAIQGLTQHKLSEIERNKGIQKTKSGLEALKLNGNIANLPENLQTVALKDAFSQRQQAVYDQALQDISSGKRIDVSKLPINSNLKGELAKQDLANQKFEYMKSQGNEKFNFAKQKEINRKTEPYIKENLDKLEAAKKSLPGILRQEELNTNHPDKFPNPTLWNIKKLLGYDWDSSLTPEALEFQKIGIQKLQGAGAIFRGKVSNQEMVQYLRQFANLMQTPEGRAVIISNEKILNEAEQLWGNAINDLIEENGGEVPEGLRQSVLKRINPELDRLTEDFKNGFKRGEVAYRVSDYNSKHPNSPVHKTLNENYKKPQQTNQISELQGMQNEQPQQQLTPLEQIPLNGTQLSRGKEPSNISEAGRLAGRLAARGLESIANVPGDLASLGLSAADLLTLGKIPQIGKANEFIRENLNARNITRGLTGEKFEPKTENERRGDEIVSDLATFLIPSAGKIKVVPALLKTALGNAAGFLGEKIGGSFGNSSLGKGIAKIGSVLLYSFAGGRKALKNVMQKSYKATDELAGAAKASASGFGKEISSLTKDLNTGIKTPGKKFVSDAISGISSYIKNGKIAVKDAIRSEKEINELLRDPQTPATAKKYLVRLSELFTKILNSYGKSNPEFAKSYNDSKDIFRGLNKASDIAQAIQKSVKPESLTSNLIKSVLTFAALKNPVALPIAGAALGVGTAIQKLTKFGQLLKNSTEARKYYKNILKAAAIENASLIQRNAKKLDKLAVEEGY